MRGDMARSRKIRGDVARCGEISHLLKVELTALTIHSKSLTYTARVIASRAVVALSGLSGTTVVSPATLIVRVVRHFARSVPSALVACVRGSVETCPTQRGREHVSAVRTRRSVGDVRWNRARKACGSVGESVQSLLPRRR